MTNYYRQLKIGNYPGDPTARRLIASGIWLRIAFIGISALAGGLIALIGGQAEPLQALAFIAGGAILAWAGWKRTRTLLDEAPAYLPSAAATIRDANVPRFGASALR